MVFAPANDFTYCRNQYNIEAPFLDSRNGANSTYAGTIFGTILHQGASLLFSTIFLSVASHFISYLSVNKQKLRYIFGPLELILVRWQTHLGDMF